MPPITPSSEPSRLPPAASRPIHAEPATPSTARRAEPRAETPERGLSWAQLAGIAEYQSWLRHLG